MSGSTAAAWRLAALLLLATAAAAAAPASQQQQQRPTLQPQQQQPPQRRPLAYVHKSLWPVAWQDVVLLLLSALILSLSAGCGLGGGVLLVPCLSLISGFPMLQTVGISNVTICAASAVNTLLNLPRSNPLRPGPLIDWDLVTLFGPMLIMGSMAGGHLAFAVPGLVSSVLVLFVLVPFCWRMLRKARLLWVAENSVKRVPLHDMHSTRFIGRSAAAQAATEAAAALAVAAADAADAAERAAGSKDVDCDVRVSKDQDAVRSGSVACKDVAAAPGSAAAPPPSPNRALRRSVSLGQAAAKLPPATATGQGAALEPALGRSSSASQRPGLLPPGMLQPGRRPHHAHPEQQQHATAPRTLAEVLGPSLVLIKTSEGAADATVQLAGESGSTASALERRHSNGLLGALGLRNEPEPDAGGPWTRGGSDGAPGQQLPGAAVSRCGRMRHEGCIHLPDLDDKMEDRLERRATTRAPKMPLAAIGAIMAFVFAANVCGNRLLPCGSWQYWLLVLSPIPFMALVWAVMRRHTLRADGWRRHLQLIQPSDVRYTPRATVIFPVVCIPAGLGGGLLCMGGGTILAPLLLELGVQPAVSAATAQAVMLLSSAGASIIYLLSGILPTDYVAAMAVLGAVATLFGQVVINAVVRRTGRCSILVAILAALFVFAVGAAVVNVANSARRIAKDPSLFTATSMARVCS